MRGNKGGIYYLKVAMIELDALCRERADKVVWQTVLPVCAGGYCTEPLVARLGRGLIQWYDVNAYTDRLRDINGWLKAMWPDRVADVTEAMRPDEHDWGDPRMYFDGLHPTQWGCQRIADAFPLQHFS